MAAEGNIVGEVGLIVKPVDNGFNADVQRIINKIESQAQFKVGADTSSASNAIQSLTGQANQLGESFAQSAINVAGITAAVFALRGAANSVIGKFSTLFDQLAQARAGFTTILKSDAAGTGLLAEIQEFARVSPFVTQELVNYSQQLLGVGLSAERITPLLEDVGNIISSVGGDTQNMGRVLFTLTQIQSIGRLAGQDAMQLQSALIPITKYLSEYLGKTVPEVKKLQEQGKITADTVFAAISAQGDQVEGAMAKATRNIAGARAILGDTITIMLQNQPVLNEIFEDIFKSIVKFSDYLSTPEVSGAINNFMAEIGKVYESLKPLGEALASIGSVAGLNSLRATTSVLQIFAGIISAIPEPALKLLASFITALGVMKAPLMLLKYVQSFKNLTTNVLGATQAGSAYVRKLKEEEEATRRATQANDQYNKSLGVTTTWGRQKGRVGGALSKAGNMEVGMGGALALGTAGTMVADGNRGERDAVGNILQYAATLAVFGPLGAIAGGGIAAITSIMDASRRAKEQMVKDAQEIGKAWAVEMVGPIDAKYGGQINENSTKEFVQLMVQNAENIESYQTVLENYQNKLKALGPMGGMSAAGQDYVGTIDAAKTALIQLKQAQDDLINDPRYAAYLNNVRDKMALYADANPELFAPERTNSRAFNAQYGSKEITDVLGGQAIPKTTEEFEALDKKIKELGLTWESISSLTFEAGQKLIDMYKELPDSVRDATRAATEFNTRLKEAKDAAAIMYDPFQEQLNNLISFNSTIETGMKSVFNAQNNLTNSTAQLSAERDALIAKEAAQAQATANNIRIEGARYAGEQAYQALLNLRYTSQLQINAVEDLQTEERITKLLELAGLVDSLENRNLIIDVATRGVQEAVTEVERLTQLLIDVQTGKIKSMPGTDISIQRQLDAANAALVALTGGSGDAEFGAEAKKKAEERDRWKVAEEAKRAAEEAARKAEQWATTVENTTNALSTAIENAADAIRDAADRWIGSIKERTQYEQAVSTGRLIRNTNRQVADVAELTAGLENLKNRGVPQSVIDALGINNVTDTRQLRKLVNSSDADLMALATSLATLNTSATDLATSQEDKRTRTNITQAIIEAAKQLDLNLSKDQAAGISNQFVITPGTNAEDIALQILNVLTSGRIGV